MTKLRGFEVWVVVPHPETVRFGAEGPQNTAGEPTIAVQHSSDRQPGAFLGPKAPKTAEVATLIKNNANLHVKN